MIKCERQGDTERLKINASSSEIIDASDEQIEDFLDFMEKTIPPANVETVKSKSSLLSWGMIFMLIASLANFW